VFLAYWRAARAHRDVLFEFYVVQQRGREKAYYSLLDRQRVLAAELQKISTLFNADSGIVFAVGSWRPAPGLHYRGHAPTISAKLRKKLREMRGVFIIVVPEWCDHNNSVMILKMMMMCVCVRVCVRSGGPRIPALFASSTCPRMATRSESAGTPTSTVLSSQPPHVVFAVAKASSTTASPAFHPIFYELQSRLMTQLLKSRRTGADTL